MFIRLVNFHSTSEYLNMIIIRLKLAQISSLNEFPIEFSNKMLYWKRAVDTGAHIKWLAYASNGKKVAAINFS